MPKRPIDPNKSIAVIARVSPEIFNSLQEEVDQGRARDRSEVIRAALKQWYALKRVGA